jgi:hypothetical protein
MCATESWPSTTNMLDTLSQIVSKHSRGARCILTHLSDQDRGTHIRPSSAVVGELREHGRSTLLGRRHNPETDDYWHEAEDVDAAEDSFCQRKVLGAKDVERRHCNYCNPCEKGALPALGCVGGVVNHNQCLYQTTDNEGVHGDDRKPGYRCEPSLNRSAVGPTGINRSDLPEK